MFFKLPRRDALRARSPPGQRSITTRSRKRLPRPPVVCCAARHYSPSKRIRGHCTGDESHRRTALFIPPDLHDNPGRPKRRRRRFHPAHQLLVGPISSGRGRLFVFLFPADRLVSDGSIAIFSLSPSFSSLLKCFCCANISVVAGVCCARINIIRIAIILAGRAQCLSIRSL